VTAPLDNQNADIEALAFEVVIEATKEPARDLIFSNHLDLIFSKK